jgi:UDP-N-acetylmuramoyl-tripeptide--D-alanyl-D-alanine ligase
MKHDRGKTPIVTAGRLIAWSGGVSAMALAMKEKRVMGLCNDSRTLRKGEVFIALETEKDDGHRHVANALSRGALAALVSKKKADMFSDNQKKRLIFTADPLAATRRIAKRYRKELRMPFIGITGSSGKTTARNFIAAVLKQALVVGETNGNWNNAIGVAMSLMRFTGEETVGVMEMGANHAGEIHDLSTLIRPEIGVITNIGYAHVGLFGSLENTARAKCEIADGMDRKKGFLMVNGDDKLLMKHAAGLNRTIVRFGFSGTCDIRASKEQATPGGTTFEVDSALYELSMPGRHFIYSALMAIGLGRHFGVEEKDIARALKAQRPVFLRGTVERKSGARFIVDCYNANPSSMKSALRLLQDAAGKDDAVAIVGDMLELGKYSGRLHAALGEAVAKSKVKRLLAVGDFAGTIAAGAIKAGMKAKDVYVAPNNVEALAIARKLVHPGDTVLLKGSRGVHLETVFEKF